MARFSFAVKRIILLGASNLTMGLAIAGGRAAAGWGPGPFRILAAAGHGRAYGVGSTVLGRSLPSIRGCALWRELAREPDLPTRALVADAGNDLAYGQSVAATAEAVRWCLDRLTTAGAATVVVLPPLASLERLTPARFLLFRSLLFPRRRFALPAILEDLARLSGELRRLAADRGAAVVEPRPDWFGSDRIHLKRRRRDEAWAGLLAGLGAPSAAPAGGLQRPLRWRFMTAERARLLGVPLRHPQPARRFADGSTVSYY